MATALVASFAGIASSCATLDADIPLTGAGALPPGFALPAGTPVAVATAISWALGQLRR